MSITSNKFNFSNRIWNHSIGYEELLFNSLDNKFAEYYSEVYPSAESYLYSFMSSGYNIAIIAISNNNNNQKSFTLSKLAKFTDNLIEFIDSNNL